MSTTLYMIIAREGDKIHYNLGGGSSTPPKPRVYNTRAKAEKYLPYFTGGYYNGAKYEAEIIEVEIP